MVRAATPLAEIGDCRERFPSDDALAALAGDKVRPYLAAHAYLLGSFTEFHQLGSFRTARRDPAVHCACRGSGGECSRVL